MINSTRYYSAKIMITFNMLELIRLLKKIIILKFSKIFDSAYYHAHYSNDKKRINNSICHYLKIGWQQGKNPSPEFDTNYYLEHNPDVKNSGLNPLIHYITVGRKEGRSPKFSISKITQIIQIG